MASRDSGILSAVFFMGPEGVAKHLLYTELEALLDGASKVAGYCDEDVRCVYARLNRYGQITALVFFTLYFDEEGLADASWNLPVERLADISAHGPDLGAGAIRLACRSQCAINWHQNELWDPDMTPGSNDFARLKRAVAENRLGLKFDVLEPELPTLSAAAEPASLAQDSAVDLASEQDKRVKLARLLKEQRLRIRTLESHRQRETTELEREQRIIVHAYKNEIQTLRQQNEQLRLQNEKLNAKLGANKQQFAGLQEKLSGQSKALQSLEQRLVSATGSERSQIEKQKLEAEVVLLTEQLERRRLELLSRDEREDLLRAELDEFKEAHLNAPTESDLFRVLNEQDVVYTAYHLGLGHITMNGREIKDYAANPLAFAAAKSFVSEAQYRAWLEHYEQPVCRFQHPDGSYCCALVEKVGAPNEFQAGLDDRCAEHGGDDAS